MNNNLPFISVIIPCYNEEHFIGPCLDSVLKNDYPKDKMEVLVIDGMSKDKTREILKEYNKEHSFIKILDNPKKLCPIGLNVGIKNAKGEIIVRLDAHNIYDKEYISKSVKYLHEHNADNVGGIWKMVPRTNDFLGKAITLVLSSPFGAGNARYKTTSENEKPKQVETVPYGCFRKEFLEKVGLFCEFIDYSEDIELNQRIIKAGGKIILAPDIVSYYYTRTSMKDFVRHTLRNGIWITYPLKLRKFLFKWRHLIPFAFVLSLIISFILALVWHIFWILFIFILTAYFFTSIWFSFKIAFREKKIAYLFALPFIFFLFHLLYGGGSIWGIIKIVMEYGR